MKRILAVRTQGVNESGIEWRVVRKGCDGGRVTERELQVYNPNNRHWEAL